MTNSFANYTITLQELDEQGAVIFDFDYDTVIPKEELERRFLNKYYFREIGYETFTMWKFKFKEQWVNRLKHYNVLFDKYKDIDPLTDFKRVKEYLEHELRDEDEKSTGSSTGTGSNTSNTVSKQRQKDTPITAYDDSDYVSFIADDNSDSTSDSESTTSSEADILKNVNKNIEGSETETIMSENELKRLNEFVNTYIDLVDRFISEFHNLFMGIY